MLPALWSCALYYMRYSYNASNALTKSTVRYIIGMLLFGKGTGMNKSAGAKRKTPRIKALSQQIGAKVTRLRLNREWTQLDLSNESGLGQGFVSRLESGDSEPCLGVLDTLATAFDLTLSELVEGIR